MGVCFCLPLTGWGLARAYNDIIFDRELGGHLKRAADANSIELAKQELDVVAKQMEAWKMTSGYTSILYTTPDEDVGFWYTNIKSCLTQINDIKPVAAQGERDLVLLKLRQTLLDHKGGHEAITVPPGITVFPYNTGYCFFGFVSGFFAFIGCCIIAVVCKD